jgi:hypothetical protein
MLRPRLLRAVVVTFCISLIYLFVFYLKSESIYHEAWLPFDDVLRNLTRVARLSDLETVSDGFVYITGKLTSSPPLIADPLFPGWNVSAIFLSRLVQVCRPRSLSSAIELKRQVLTQWVDESNLRYPDNSDPLPIWYRSANFSNAVNLGSLNLSDRLLNHGLFELTVRRPPVRGPQPANFTAFPGGWFYASNTDNLTQRILGGRYHSDGIEPVAQAAGFLIGTLVLSSGGFHRSSKSLSRFEDAGYGVMQHCRKGDIRIRQLFLSSSTVSIVAWKSGSTLTTRIVEDKLIGTIRKGVIEPEKMFQLEMGDEEAERLKFKLLVLIMTTVTVLLATSNYAWKVAIFLVVGIAVGLGKSVIWNEGLFRIDVWFALLFLAFGALSTLWRHEIADRPPVRF